MKKMPEIVDKVPSIEGQILPLKEPINVTKKVMIDKKIQPRQKYQWVKKPEIKIEEEVKVEEKEGKVE